ncbi:hypothetical protein ABLT12_28595 [Pseudomonas aeruginosa]|uniref:hypothetical protein n=1 Tax=Pseudomonas aeruginosa TaxID=287 RepID=UPI003129D4FE
MSSRPLNQLSDLFFAIGDAVHAAGLGVSVANYEEFDGKVGDATVLIELERTTPATRHNDGRYVHDVSVTLHAVVARWRKYANLEAINLATALERLADCNRWGFHGRQCNYPEDLHSGPSIFQRGAEGYDAWGVTFRQRLAIGEVEPEPTLNTAPLVAFTWRVDPDDPANYQPLEV